MGGKQCRWFNHSTGHLEEKVLRRWGVELGGLRTGPVRGEAWQTMEVAPVQKQNGKDDPSVFPGDFVTLSQGPKGQYTLQKCA